MGAEAQAKFETRAKIIKAMAHPTRLFIVDQLSHGEKCVCELTEMVGADISTVSKHLSVLKNVGIVRDRKSGWQVYYSLGCSCVLDFFECVESVMRSSVKKVIFVCVHNSGRSQMAEAFAKRLGAGKVEAESAGTQPADGLNPVVVEAMREIGYDMAGHHPKVMTPEMVDSADRIITMGCGVDAGTCPAVFVPSEDWGLDDPKDQSIDKVREIRDRIKEEVEKLVKEVSGE